MPRRGPGFGRDEIERLLTSIENILPIGGHEWDAVASQHEMYFPDLSRSRDALKRKFSNLYATRIPTGDPTIPPDVLRAKRVYEEIKKKAEISDGEEEYDEGDDGDQHFEGGDPSLRDDNDNEIVDEEQQQSEDIVVGMYV